MELMDFAPNFSIDQLTQSQKAAVLHRDGPLLILAGPGSGKTRVITSRIAQLIKDGVSPYNICAITFTNKAAEEMRQRTFDMGVTSGLQVSTFHSLCVRILRQYAQMANLEPNFSIYSDAEQKKCVKDAIADCNVASSNFMPSRVLNAISKFKNDLESVEDVAKRADGFYLEILAKIYKRYQEILLANNALDFDDLLVRTAYLLRDRPEVRSELSRRFQYLMVDEYQDTNHTQYQIAKGLSIEHGNICVTGDPDQSIYRWRGADIANILAFEKDYPNAKVVKLEENFRSTPEILSVADKLIANNSKRKEKRLIATCESGNKVETNVYSDEQEESLAVARKIKSLISSGANLNEIAVLYRVNSMSRALEEAFVNEQIPYSIVRGVEFYSRKEIRDMIAYLKLIANPSDNVALERIINTPARGIGKTSLGRVADYAKARKISMYEAVTSVAFIDTISKAAQSKIAKFGHMIHKFTKLLDEPSCGIADLMETVYLESGMSDSLKPNERGEDTARANVDELISSAAKYDKETESQQTSLFDYLQSIALYSDTDAYDANSPTVSLMTLHAAKGLEFENAFIVGLEEGLLPHERSKENPEELEEERRLFFVGITRAKRNLNISYAKYRSMRGMLNRTIPSKFLYEIGMSPQNAYANSYGSQDSFTSKPKKTSDYVPKPKSTALYRAGDSVRHSKFGLGKVKEYLDLGEKSVVTVRFDSGQTKALLLKYAKLDKIG